MRLPSERGWLCGVQSKERRRWILSSLATLSDTSKSKIRVKTIFIEVTLTKDGLVDNILEQKLDRDIREG